MSCGLGFHRYRNQSCGVLRPELLGSEVLNLRGQELPRRAWVGPAPGHYKHCQFLCLSFPPYAAQRKGWPRQISGGVPFRPSPAGSQGLQCARGLGGYEWGSVWEHGKALPTLPHLFHPERLPRCMRDHIHHHPHSPSLGAASGLSGCGRREPRAEPRVQDEEQARRRRQGAPGRSTWLHAAVPGQAA